MRKIKEQIRKYFIGLFLYNAVIYISREAGLELNAVEREHIAEDIRYALKKDLIIIKMQNEIENDLTEYSVGSKTKKSPET
jgi:hypothetical protein